MNDILRLDSCKGLLDFYILRCKPDCLPQCFRGFLPMTVSDCGIVVSNDGPQYGRIDTFSRLVPQTGQPAVHLR